MVVQFGLRLRAVKQEIPSTSLRAGSSLRLKNGSAQDDKGSEDEKARTPEASSALEKSDDSGGNVPRHGQIPQSGTQDLGHVIGGAHVAGAGFERGDPQLLIRYAMGADDR
jgi:hypothetical protein